MKLAIRPAEKGDIPTLQAIEKSAARLFSSTRYPELAQFDPLSSERLLAHIANGDMLLVAHVTDKNPGLRVGGGGQWVGKVGFALAYPLDDGLHLQDLSVHEAFQGRGIGRALLAATVDYAMSCANSACPFTHISLTTYRDIAWNAPFYQSAGFSILPKGIHSPGLRAILEREIAQGANAVTRCAMALSLTGPFYPK